MKKGGYWRMFVTVALIAALVCGCAGWDARNYAVDAGGSLVSKHGQIAFTRITEQHGTRIESDIYAVNVDGTGERRLTRTPKNLDGMPAWSPGGERMAFVSDRDGGNWEIYAMDPDGTEQRRLTDSPENEAFLDWSPDGEKIAFATDPTGDPAIWVMDADGSDRKRLASGLFPTWSPDGERIAYTDYFGERPYLAVMSADGSEQRGIGASLLQKVFGIGVAEEPSWAPHGERISYASYVAADNEEIFLMDMDGSHRSRLADILGSSPYWGTGSPGRKTSVRRIGTLGRSGTSKGRHELEQEIEESRKSHEQEIEERRGQDTSLQAYLDEMRSLLLDKGLLGSSEEAGARTLARARTLTALNQVGPERKRSIIQFLRESHLIHKHTKSNRAPDQVGSQRKRSTMLFLKKLGLVKEVTPNSSLR